MNETESNDASTSPSFLPIIDFPSLEGRDTTPKDFSV